MGARDPTRDAVVHGLVRAHAASLLARAEEAGGPLPRYVVAEFEAYLRCGVLACGFLRARCAGCGHDRLVAFSCKHRGVCSSCGGRRMSETAAKQCDRVLPAVPYRQWVLSLPWELRLPVARDPARLNAVSRVFFEELRGWLRRAVGSVPGARVEAAAVTFVQRFGGSLNLNPHLHVLVADGVFACRQDGSAPEFIPTRAPTRDDLREVIARVIDRLETIARRRERLRVDAGDDAAHEDGMEGMRRMAGGRGTFARVDERKKRESDEDDEGHCGQEDGAKGGAARGLVAERGGFNLHAGVRVEAEAREALERLCRYMARPAVAAGRVSVLADGLVAYRVKSPRSGAATHRVMTPLEFMARLAALVPPPRTPLVRYHGVLAPNSPWRVAVVPLPPIEEAIGGACAERGVAAVEGGVAAVASGVAAVASAVDGTRSEVATRSNGTKSGRIEWARLLWRVWKIDALKCPACDGRMTIIAALTERAGIVRVLEHLGVSTEVPRMRRTRDGP